MPTTNPNRGSSGFHDAERPPDAVAQVDRVAREEVDLVADGERQQVPRVLDGYVVEQATGADQVPVHPASGGREVRLLAGLQVTTLDGAADRVERVAAHEQRRRRRSRATRGRC